jgi:hypothetical protein
MVGRGTTSAPVPTNVHVLVRRLGREDLAAQPYCVFERPGGWK